MAWVCRIRQHSSRHLGQLCLKLHHVFYAPFEVFRPSIAIPVIPGWGKKTKTEKLFLGNRNVQILPQYLDLRLT